MNLLEIYVTNITNERKIDFEWGSVWGITADTNCYGREEIQKNLSLIESEYRSIK